MTDWHVGQKVVCINDTWAHPSYVHVQNRPVVNGIYVVRAVLIAHRVPHLRLREVRNPKMNWTEIGFAEIAFAANRFRPVVEPKRKTSIEVFKKLLVTSKQPMNVE